MDEIDRIVKRSADYPVDLYPLAEAACSNLTARIAALEDEVARLREVEQAARYYFERYLIDEAEDAQHCVCGQQQHEAALRLSNAFKVQP